MIGILLLLFLAAIAFGAWARFGAVQWIWLMAGIAFTMVLIWVLLLVFFIGPEMRRMGPVGG